MDTFFEYFPKGGNGLPRIINIEFIVSVEPDLMVAGPKSEPPHRLLVHVSTGKTYAIEDGTDIMMFRRKMDEYRAFLKDTGHLMLKADRH